MLEDRPPTDLDCARVPALAPVDEHALPVLTGAALFRELRSKEWEDVAHHVPGYLGLILNALMAEIFFCWSACALRTGAREIDARFFTNSARRLR